MRISMCHYSFNRTWKAEAWNCDRLAAEVKNLGLDAVDFHAGLLGDPKAAPANIKTALSNQGMSLSGLSLSNNFNQEDPAELLNQIEMVKTWILVAAEVEAPVSRIFGGHIHDRSDRAQLERGFARIIDALGEVAQAAERSGVVLALENHGGLPCTGEEQVRAIETINSPFLKATIDVGNYMQGGQEGHEGTAVAAKHAAYVHFKDYRKKTPNLPWELGRATVGEGDVDHLKCLKALKNAGYNGDIAIEYEGIEEERIGVPKSVAYTKKILTAEL